MFNWSSRRRELAEQAAQRELADDAARNASRARCPPSSQDLAGLFRDDLPTVTGPRVVTGIGPKGGSEKATTRGLRRPGPTCRQLPVWTPQPRLGARWQA
jgi:hypothetical protein